MSQEQGDEGQLNWGAQVEDGGDKMIDEVLKEEENDERSISDTPMLLITNAWINKELKLLYQAQLSNTKMMNSFTCTTFWS